MNKQESIRPYLLGFVLSVGLTLAAYGFVNGRWLVGWTAVLAIVVLAIAQLMVQLIYFLHLGRESKPRWNLMVLSFAAIVVLIVVFGSLWIMNNLNYHMMSSAETDKNIMEDEGIRK